MWPEVTFVLALIAITGIIIGAVLSFRAYARGRGKIFLASGIALLLSIPVVIYLVAVVLLAFSRDH